MSHGQYTSQAIVDVAAERSRQIEVKGWTPKHDDAHDRGELAQAAASFALRAIKDQGDFPIYAGIGLAPLRAERNCGWIGLGGLVWPWEEEFPYDDDKRRRLVKAAALLIAEIERLDRVPSTGGRDG